MTDISDGFVATIEPIQTISHNTIYTLCLTNASLILVLLELDTHCVERMLCMQ